jgi:hypothetical protein
VPGVRAAGLLAVFILGRLRLPARGGLLDLGNWWDRGIWCVAREGLVVGPLGLAVCRRVRPEKDDIFLVMKRPVAKGSVMGLGSDDLRSFGGRG